MEPVARVDLGGVVQGVVPVHADGVVEQLLRGGDGSGRSLARHPHRELARARYGLPPLDELVGDAERDGSGAVDAFGIEQQAAGDMPGHPPGEKGQHQGGDIADGDLGVGEPRRRLGDDDVARRGEAAAAADGGPVHRRQRELRVTEQCLEQGAKTFRVGPQPALRAAGGDLLQLSQIGAGRKVTAGAGQNHRANVGIVSDRL